MTNEEAIEVFKNDIEICTIQQKQACDMAIKALEQQSRDCKTCKHSNNGKCAYTEKCHECMWENQYEPQRKHGKWIDFDGEYGVWECSECKTAYILNDGTPEDNGYQYCPSCGCQMDADMRGDSE